MKYKKVWSFLLAICQGVVLHYVATAPEDPKEVIEPHCCCSSNLENECHEDPIIDHEGIVVEKSMPMLVASSTALLVSAIVFLNTKKITPLFSAWK